MLKFALAGAGLAAVAAYALGSGHWLQVSQGWYAALAKPAWQPPGWVFGAVWSYSFLMLAVVAVAVAWRGPEVIGDGLAIIWTSLLVITAGLGVLWSWAFSGLHALLPAAVALTASATLTVGMLVIAGAMSGWLVIALLPYQAWLIVATSLSWGYVMLNRAG